ncbi:hypothetical protein MTR_2g090840 [Medicago truncatula]|uniref:Uncharacterized protein n=1 Tax=Medicago truncatula TaxID=3880 RepID=G7ZUK9_MEDTR|nr:hypothetical protein MTR_2g090840 [Medicago truncatula]
MEKEESDRGSPAVVDRFALVGRRKGSHSVCSWNSSHSWKHDKPENYRHGRLTLGSYNATYESHPVQTCSRCGLEGSHNRFRCTNQGVMSMPPHWPPPPRLNNASQGNEVALDLSQFAPQTQEQLFDVNVQGPQPIGIRQ